MGKKSKRAAAKDSASAQNKTGVGERFSRTSAKALPVSHSYMLAQDAFNGVSDERLFEFYNQVWDGCMREGKEDEKEDELFRIPVGRRVTDSAMQTDPMRSREIMTYQLQAIPTGPWSPEYVKAANKELKQLGGMKITFVEGRKASKTFVYTTGFTAIGAYELYWPNVHKSMDEVVGSLMRDHYDMHKRGKEKFFDDDHSGCSYHIGFVTRAPDEKEATLIKLHKTLATTRLYGIANYDILEVVPVCYKVGKLADREETVLMGPEMGSLLSLAKVLGNATPPIKGFRPILGSPGMLELCAFCKNIHDTSVSEKALLKCQGCKNAYYCSKECQQSDWKKHKPNCLKKEARNDKQFREYYKRFAEAAGVDIELYKSLLES